MLLPTDPDVQEALDSIGQQVKQNLAQTIMSLLGVQTVRTMLIKINVPFFRTIHVVVID